jgi:hypothetical protein
MLLSASMRVVGLLIWVFPLLVVGFGCCPCRGKTAAAPPAAAGAPPAGLAAAPAAPGTPAAPAAPPKTQEACAACNGVWGVHGLADAPSCNCRTKDGGKPCRDGAECESACLADEKKFETVELGPPPKGFYSGRCAEFQTSFGCFKFIPNGVRAKGPQLQEDAAESLCVD